METPYGITNDAGQLFGKAVIYDAGNVSVYITAPAPTGAVMGQHDYQDFASAQEDVGGTWALFPQH